MKTAIAIAAHPDDIEILMSGTLMRLANAGYEIHYWNLANGSCGTTEYSVDQIVKIRREESIEAAKLIGAHYHESICNDLEIFYEKPTLARVASVIREVAPEIILTHSIWRTIRIRLAWSAPVHSADRCRTFLSIHQRSRPASA
jgi:LmbE family N-acetylglucosaminyl deacetylase